MKSPTSKTIPGPALLFEAAIQAWGHRSESGSRFTGNPARLEGDRITQSRDGGNGWDAIAILEISNKVAASLQRLDSLKSY